MAAMMRMCLASLLLMLAACASAPDAAPPVVEAAQPIVIGESRTIQSTALGEARGYNVYLPRSYETGDKRYPVLYLLDGGLDQDFLHIAGLAQYGALSGHYEEMIVVGVETKDRRKELTYPTMDARELADLPTSGGAAAFRGHLEQVKTAVNAFYRTDGREALMGESLAGLFVVDSFLNAPDTADIFLAISPSLWWDGGGLGKGAREKIAGFARQKQQKLYLAVADEKGVMREAAKAIASALQAEKPENVAWMYSERDDLSHSTIYHREALEALSWAFDAARE
jgi:hypothetical protein